MAQDGDIPRVEARVFLIVGGIIPAGGDRSIMAEILEVVEEIRREVQTLNQKIDLLLERQETVGMMRLSEQSLSLFLDEEPDLYTVRDCRVVYQ